MVLESCAVTFEKSRLTADFLDRKVLNKWYDGAGLHKVEWVLKKVIVSPDTTKDSYRRGTKKIKIVWPVTMPYKWIETMFGDQTARFCLVSRQHPILTYLESTMRRQTILIIIGLALYFSE